MVLKQNVEFDLLKKAINMTGSANKKRVRRSQRITKNKPKKKRNLERDKCCRGGQDPG